MRQSVWDIIARASKVPLIKDELDKPLDTGSGLVTASIGSMGLILSIGGYSERWGYAVCHPYRQFPTTEHYNTPYVRSYRRQLASLHHPGMGFHVPMPEQEFRYSWLGPSLPLAEAENEKLRFCLLAFPDTNDPRLIWHVCLATNKTERHRSMKISWAGNVSLNRSSYSQLTEGGPIPPPEPLNVLNWKDGGMSLDNPNLGMSLVVSLLEDPSVQITARESKDKRESPSQIHFCQDYVLTLGPNEKTWVAAGLKLVESDSALPSSGSAENLTPSLMESVFEENNVPKSIEDYVICRNLSYVKSCCGVPTSEDSLCLLTDHQLLPLSWNRDAYYVARFFMAYARSKEKMLSQAAYSLLSSTVRRHLTWLFKRTEKRNGCWGRSHLANGRMKDGAFQLDQQLYPVLELFDYADFAGEWSACREFLPELRELVKSLLALRRDNEYLLPTQETPADDEVAYPYHLSSQILWWKTLKALSPINEAYGLLDEDLSYLAEKTRQAIWHHMRVDGPMFCYASDLAGNCQLYHDANDLPTAYAPEWGFCSAADPTWRNTMEFAFSPANKSGTFAGAFGGLGSVHTPAPWPLGNVQKIVYSRLTGDIAAMEEEIRHTLRFAQADGLLPEAYDPNTGEVVSRHWFAWPGAALSYELLKIHSSV